MTDRKAGVEAGCTGAQDLGKMFLPVPGRVCGRALPSGDWRLPADGSIIVRYSYRSQSLDLPIPLGAGATGEQSHLPRSYASAHFGSRQRMVAALGQAWPMCPWMTMAAPEIDAPPMGTLPARPAATEVAVSCKLNQPRGAVEP
jgi:hypothetical protein